MVRISGPIFTLCKEIKREAACRLAFDFRSCQASKRNDIGAERCRNICIGSYIRGEQVKPRRGITQGRRM